MRRIQCPYLVTRRHTNVCKNRKISEAVKAEVESASFFGDEKMKTLTALVHGERKSIKFIENDHVFLVKGIPLFIGIIRLF